MFKLLNFVSPGSTVREIAFAFHQLTCRCYIMLDTSQSPAGAKNNTPKDGNNQPKPPEGTGVGSVAVSGIPRRTGSSGNGTDHSSRPAAAVATGILRKPKQNSSTNSSSPSRALAKTDMPEQSPQRAAVHPVWERERAALRAEKAELEESLRKVNTPPSTHSPSHNQG